MKTNAEANAILDQMFGAGSYTPPATWYLALFTAAPTPSTGGTEVTGGSYGRVGKTNNLTNFPAAVSRAKSNGTAITFPQATADWGTIVAFGWFDASTAGNLRHFAEITPKVVANGDTPSFSVGQLNWTES